MQLFCKGGVVVAWHDDGQTIAASTYGDGVSVIPWSGAMSSLPRVGNPPPAGQPDTRPYAAPVPDLTAYAAAKRYAVETAGITVNGMHVDTSRAAQAQITGAWATVQVTPSATIQWKAADGSWTALNAAAITALAEAVTAHVQACFSAEKQVHDGLAASPPTIATTDQVDAVFAAITV